MTTETELIDLLVTATADARAALQGLAEMATASGNVTITLRDGTAVTIPSLTAQQATLTAAFNTLQLGWHTDFGSAFTSQSVTRDAAGLVTGVTTTLSSGWQIVESFTRGSDGLLATITATVKDGSGATQLTATRTVTYINGLYASMA